MTLCVRWTSGKVLSAWGTGGLLPVRPLKDTPRAPNMHHLKLLKMPRFLLLLDIHTRIHLNAALSIGMSAAVSLYEEWNYTIYFLRQIRFHSGMSPLLDTWNSTWNAVCRRKMNKQLYIFKLGWITAIQELIWSNLWTFLIHTFLPV